MIKQFFTCCEKLVCFRTAWENPTKVSAVCLHIFSSLTSFVFVEFWYWFPNSWSQFPNDPVLNWVVYLGAVWSTSHEGRWGHHFGSWKENKKVLQVDDDGLAKFQPTHCYQDLFCSIDFILEFELSSEIATLPLFCVAVRSNLCKSILNTIVTWEQLSRELLLFHRFFER